MPTLPTFTVNDAVATRLMAAFANQTGPDGEPLTPQQAYKQWLRERLVEYVTTTENRSRRSTLETDLGP